jgi:hypothetical protein
MDLLLGARAALGSTLAYWGDLEAFRRLDRKDDLAVLARDCGVEAPETFASLEAARAPLVAKPVRSSSARGVRYLRDAAAVAAFRPPADQPYLYQSYVAGEGVGYSVFAREGAIVKGFGHRRLAEYPVTGGSSVYREGFESPALVAAAQRLLAATRWSGFAMFEFKRAPDGRLFLLEANPRIWGSIHQGLAAGVNYLEPLLGPATIPADPRRRTYLSPVAYAAFLFYLARGRSGPFVDFVRHLPRNRADVAWTDPGGWLASLLRLL